MRGARRSSFLPSQPAPPLSSPSTSSSKPVAYRNVSGASIRLREGPQRTATLLPLAVSTNAVCRIERTLKGDDGVVWLRLSNGRGWVREASVETGAVLLQKVPLAELRTQTRRNLKRKQSRVQQRKTSTAAAKTRSSRRSRSSKVSVRSPTFSTSTSASSSPAYSLSPPGQSSSLSPLTSSSRLPPNPAPVATKVSPRAAVVRPAARRPRAAAGGSSTSPIESPSSQMSASRLQIRKQLRRHKERAAARFHVACRIQKCVRSLLPTWRVSQMQRSTHSAAVKMQSAVRLLLVWRRVADRHRASKALRGKTAFRHSALVIRSAVVRRRLNNAREALVVQEKAREEAKENERKRKATIRAARIRARKAKIKAAQAAAQAAADAAEEAAQLEAAERARAVAAATALRAAKMHARKTKIKAAEMAAEAAAQASAEATERVALERGHAVEVAATLRAAKKNTRAAMRAAQAAVAMASSAAKTANMSKRRATAAATSRRRRRVAKKTKSKAAAKSARKGKAAAEASKTLPPPPPVATSIRATPRSSPSRRSPSRTSPRTTPQSSAAAWASVQAAHRSWRILPTAGVPPRVPGVVPQLSIDLRESSYDVVQIASELLGWWVIKHKDRQSPRKDSSSAAAAEAAAEAAAGTPTRGTPAQRRSAFGMTSGSAQRRSRAESQAPLWTDLVWSDFPLSMDEAGRLHEWQWNGVGARARASLRAARQRHALMVEVSHESAPCTNTRVIRSRVGLVTKFAPRRNRFPGNVLASKCGLFNALSRTQSVFPRQYKFCPPSWILPTQLEKLKRFWENDPSGRRGDGTLIVKPDGLSRGRGIFLTKEIPRLLTSYDFVKAGRRGLPVPDGYREHASTLVQRYVADPFTINGFKFDLRLYVVVTQLDCRDPNVLQACGETGSETGVHEAWRHRKRGEPRVFLHREGLLRFCTAKYEAPAPENMAENFIHLTNYSVNKASPIFTTSDTTNVSDEAQALRRMQQYSAQRRAETAAGAAAVTPVEGGVAAPVGVMPLAGTYLAGWSTEEIKKYGAQSAVKKLLQPLASLPSSSYATKRTRTNVKTRGRSTLVPQLVGNDAGAIDSNEQGAEVRHRLTVPMVPTCGTDTVESMMASPAQVRIVDERGANAPSALRTPSTSTPPPSPLPPPPSSSKMGSRKRKQKSKRAKLGILQLRQKLRKSGLSTLGRKSDLIARLEEYNKFVAEVKIKEAKKEAATLPEEMVRALHEAAAVECNTRASAGVGLCEPEDCARVRLAPEGYKWTLSAFMLWLAQNGHDASAVWDRISDLVVKTVIAGSVGGMTDLYRSAFGGSAVNSVGINMDDEHPEEGMRSFELLGFDVILDNNLQPHILEVNQGPSLETGSALDRLVKESVVVETLRLAAIPPLAPERKAAARTRAHQRVQASAHTMDHTSHGLDVGSATEYGYENAEHLADLWDDAVDRATDEAMVVAEECELLHEQLQWRREYEDAVLQGYCRICPSLNPHRALMNAKISAQESEIMQRTRREGEMTKSAALRKRERLAMRNPLSYSVEAYALQLLKPLVASAREVLARDINHNAIGESRAQVLRRAISSPVSVTHVMSPVHPEREKSTTVEKKKKKLTTTKTTKTKMKTDEKTSKETKEATALLRSLLGPSLTTRQVARTPLNQLTLTPKKIGAALSSASASTPQHLARRDLLRCVFAAFDDEEVGKIDARRVAVIFEAFGRDPSKLPAMNGGVSFINFFKCMNLPARRSADTATVTRRRATVSKCVRLAGVATVVRVALKKLMHEQFVEIEEEEEDNGEGGDETSDAGVNVKAKAAFTRTSPQPTNRRASSCSPTAGRSSTRNVLFDRTSPPPADALARAAAVLSGVRAKEKDRTRGGAPLGGGGSRLRSASPPMPDDAFGVALPPQRTSRGHRFVTHNPLAMKKTP